MLRTGAHDVVIPEAVIAEIHGHGEDDPTVKAVLALDWLIIQSAPDIPSPIIAWDLGPGESAVLTLALAAPGSRAVIDDRDARRCARSLSISFIGTLGLVLLAKEEGRIAAARPIVEPGRHE
jgi:predicted nucleic acid-binding protein